MDTVFGVDFWIGLLEIVWINILLSGDNAVVIAMAARSLPPAQQKQAVFFGSSAAVVLRIVLTLVAATLLALPWLQIAGGLLLLWIGTQLLAGEQEGEHDGRPERSGLLAAVRTILIADLVMSLDNVIAVAAAAEGDMVLLVLGLAISIPLVVFGSTLMIQVMERFPIIVMLGAALIGWVGGATVASDRVLEDAVAANPWLHYSAAGIGALFVVFVGRWLQTRQVAAR